MRRQSDGSSRLPRSMDLPARQHGMWRATVSTTKIRAASVGWAAMMRAAGRAFFFWLALSAASSACAQDAPPPPPPGPPPQEAPPPESAPAPPDKALSEPELEQ